MQASELLEIILPPPIHNKSYNLFPPYTKNLLKTKNTQEQQPKIAERLNEQIISIIKDEIIESKISFSTFQQSSNFINQNSHHQISQQNYGYLCLNIFDCIFDYFYMKKQTGSEDILTLQNQIKKEVYWGVNTEDALIMFIQYSSKCRDPANIFRYMQQQQICVKMPQYWLNKSKFYLSFGDIPSCIFCLKNAEQKIDQGHNLQTKIRQIKAHISLDIKSYLMTFSRKRTTQEWFLTNVKEQDINQKWDFQVINFYQHQIMKKYKQDKYRSFCEQRKLLQFSFLKWKKSDKSEIKTILIHQWTPIKLAKCMKSTFMIFFNLHYAYDKIQKVELKTMASWYMVWLIEKKGIQYEQIKPFFGHIQLFLKEILLPEGVFINGQESIQNTKFR